MGSLKPPHKSRTAYINMDETCIKMFDPSRTPGLIRVPKGQRKKTFLEKKQPAPLSKQRSACSLVAFATDDAEVARCLPQILVMNKRLLNQRQEARLRAAASRTPWLHIWVRDSAWVNAKALCEIVRTLGRCLAPVQPYAHCVLVMDCCPAHVCTPVLGAAATSGIALTYVPASMTDVMQPLDVYIFAMLKMKLRRAMEARYLASPDGTASNVEVLESLIDVLRTTLHGQAWPGAFRGCGFGSSQVGLGKRLLRALNWPESHTPVVSSDLPSLQELMVIWPKRKSIPIDWLFYLARRHVPPAPPVAPPLPPPAHPAPGHFAEGQELPPAQQPLAQNAPGVGSGDAPPPSGAAQPCRPGAAAPVAQPTAPLESRPPPVPPPVPQHPLLPQGRLLQRSRSDLGS